TRFSRDWSSDVCSSDLAGAGRFHDRAPAHQAGATAVSPAHLPGQSVLAPQRALGPGEPVAAPGADPGLSAAAGAPLRPQWPPAQERRLKGAWAAVVPLRRCSVLVSSTLLRPSPSAVAGSANVPRNGCAVPPPLFRCAGHRARRWTPWSAWRTARASSVVFLGAGGSRAQGALRSG